MWPAHLRHRMTTVPISQPMPEQWTLILNKKCSKQDNLSPISRKKLSKSQHSSKIKRLLKRVSCNNLLSSRTTGILALLGNQARIRVKMIIITFHPRLNKFPISRHNNWPSNHKLILKPKLKFKPKCKLIKVHLSLTTWSRLRRILKSSMSTRRLKGHKWIESSLTKSKIINTRRNLSWRSLPPISCLLFLTRTQLTNHQSIHRLARGKQKWPSKLHTLKRTTKSRSSSNSLRQPSNKYLTRRILELISLWKWPLSQPTWRSKLTSKSTKCL